MEGNGGGRYEVTETLEREEGGKKTSEENGRVLQTRRLTLPILAVNRLVLGKEARALSSLLNCGSLDADMTRVLYDS